MTKMEKLLRSAQKVFTVNDLAVLWQSTNRRRLFEIIKYYVRVGRLYTISRGVYATEPQSNNLEVAMKLFSPAYISYVTALGIHGINFQYDASIHAMASASKTIRIFSGETFVYHQIKARILFNEAGLIKEAEYWIASPERAICDTLYLSPDFYFDHPNTLNVEKIRSLVSIYRNAALIKRVNELIANIHLKEMEDHA